jgi:undecaprenyl-diphosphatase
MTTKTRLVLIALLIGAFGALARAIPDSGGIAFDVAVANWLAAGATDTGVIVFTWISWLGDTALAGLLVAAVLLLLYRRRWAAAITVVIASVGAPLIDIALKPIFHRGRPDYAVELITGPTWSFPSGHAMSSLVGFGIVAYFRYNYESSAHRRRVIAWAACFIIAAVGLSRLYLGVHYLSDVLGGFLAGGIWLLACIQAYHFAVRRRQK